MNFFESLLLLLAIANALMRISRPLAIPYPTMLGAAVAPPDAAAATAVLRSVCRPRRSVVVLKGESLLNDASALILFGAALSFHTRDATTSEVTLRVLSAAPLGVLLGVA